MAKLLQIMDDNGDKRLTKDELRYGLRDYGIDLNASELDQVFAVMDRDKNGFVDITEFLVAIKGDMNSRRKSVVRLAFNSLDKDGSGEVTVDELCLAYDFSHSPEVSSGKKTVNQAAREFMHQWDRLEADGLVTLPEFEDYYKEISASIDGDDYFELMIRNAWRIAGGEGAAANTANKRVLVTNKDGTQQVVAINNELGMVQGKGKDAMADIQKRLAQQGINADKIDLFGGDDSTEKPKGRGAPPTRCGNNIASAPRQQAWAAEAAHGSIPRAQVGGRVEVSDPNLLDSTRTVNQRTKPHATNLTRLGELKDLLLAPKLL
jgi:calcyphosin